MKSFTIKKILIFIFITGIVCFIPGKVSADYIVGNGINVRKGPGTNYDKITTISRDDKEIKVVSKTGDWSKIILANGTQGYIKSSFLRQRSYMKATGTLNIRSAANTSSTILGQLHSGDVVAVIRYGIRTAEDENNNNHKGWYRIYDLKTGIIGWCSEKYLTGLNPKKISSSSISLKTSASSSSSTLKTLYSGDHIYLISENASSNWSKVVSNGIIGYIKNNTYTNGGEYVYITTLTSHSGRNKNIAKAAGLINNKKIYAGNTFSYLSYLGDVTQAGGYYQAPEIINGVLVENNTTFGGGICQVSSTLYNALQGFKTTGNITIIERWPHSTKAKYVPYNLDAMVSYNSGFNFKFRSNLNLKITTEIINSSPKRLSVKVESF